MKMYLRYLLFGALVSVMPAVTADVIDEQLKIYSANGAIQFSASNGKKLWNKPFPDPEKPGQKRSCTSCHTNSLQLPGKHIRTGKIIDPMDPAVNNKRFTDAETIEKWFKRNCKWVMDRLCTSQEKGDLLLFLRGR